MLIALFIALLISNGFAIQTKNEVCTLQSICDNIVEITSQVADIRKEQERQANILEGSPALFFEPGREPKALITKNNELCTLLSICNNLAALSSALADVRAEQERQADLLEKSCKTETASYPANCYEALKDSQKSGVTEIRVPEYSDNPFKVACDQESHGGGWTIILRRTDGSEDFFREWKDYEKGFGQVDGEYFVGLGPLHALTSSVEQELLIILEDIAGEGYELYDNFRVSGVHNNYTLESVGNYTGTAGDALEYHVGMQFSTKDHDNARPLDFNCAASCSGAWWYNVCYQSNLAGLYGDWLRWNSNYFYYPLKTAIMMIRPKS
ncbi:microfibril-associated glycoprotein 4-like [Drosophila kikkawai]|uniref:Microfibril-associated glycoprotein 4-like n=1 Tax=Drosophila kikkawai TaxID=30033 RepID=A0A6P4I9C9_DROKI|nr:fibrinogen-like protein A [Drosophila kikkawai]